MNRFNRDFALVSSDGKIISESHNATSLETLRSELSDEGLESTVVKSDLPRPKGVMTIDELLASEDPVDQDFLEMIFQHDTFNNPDDDPFADEVDLDDEDEFYEPEDQHQGDVEGLYDDRPEF